MSKSTDMSNMLKQRPWLGQYPEGVPADIDETQYESLVELLEESFKKNAKKTQVRMAPPRAGT